ncbi:MAG: hypothetical protein ACI8WB_001612 [Phenylobacterium sp.]|jgi:hypothetical protein
MTVAKKSILILWALATGILLSSCSTQVSDYQDSTPPFDIKTYFNGPLTAWGMIQDYNGKVTRRFCVELVGSWQSEQGELKETFYFDDGEISYRNWQLTRHQENQYTGTAADVIGVAEGEQNGFAFQWQYVLSVNIDDTDYQFTLDDWMYQIDQYRVFNKTKMQKLGVTVADITLFFDKQQPLRQCDTKNSQI